ncbi:MAG: RNA methyltransferase, partial [Deltaproteobacteria bacterium]|nr:RNA methyltransferase [Deltaproteobacteria bacterium]
MNYACVNGGGQHSVVCVDIPLVLEQESAVSGSARQALALWSLRVGESITLRDCNQCWFRARSCRLDNEGVTILPFEVIDVPESPIEICVFQALPSNERFELVVQKLTEIGVTHIVPFVSQRSLTLEARDAEQQKSHRWTEVILKAAKQCQRGLLPELAPVRQWDDVYSELSAWDVKVLLDEQGRGWSLADGIGGGRPTRIAIVVGPEGGFDRDEVELAQQHGVVP